jgi:hypothetical protein
LVVAAHAIASFSRFWGRRSKEGGRISPIRIQDTQASNCYSAAACRTNLLLQRHRDGDRALRRRGRLLGHLLRRRELQLAFDVFAPPSVVYAHSFSNQQDECVRPHICMGLMTWWH